ncbi:MAG: hypothetical protein ACI4PF_00135 [Christensenellales bacterium]
MTKKKKIIIVSICLSVILLGTVIGIIIATWKRFDLTPNNEFVYNNHISMEVVGVPQGYTSNTTFYSNATIITENTNNNKFGVFSYIENQIIIPSQYSSGNIKAVKVLDAEGLINEQHIFKCIGDNGEIAYYNDKGDRLNITRFDANSSQNYGYIKERDLDLKLKRSGVKVNDSNDFVDKKIAITSAEFKQSFVRNGIYQYEEWQVTDIEGNEYHNLYKVENGNRELVQTLNNNIGNSINSSLLDLSSLEDTLYFLKDGTSMLLKSSVVQNNTDGSFVLEMNIYDIHFNLKENVYINVNDNLYSSFRVGNSMYLQYRNPASEKKYDFAETKIVDDMPITTYYQLETYKLNLKTGKLSNVSLDYLVEDYNSGFNIETIVLHARNIKNKLLEPEQLLLINDRLQIKEIDYEFSSLTKVTDDRYIAHSTYGDYLIDKNYDKVCFLGKFDNIFTTKDAIMLSSNETGYTFVCDMEGTIVKRYLNSEITDLHSDTYYMVSTKKELNGVTYVEKHLERLGVRQNTIYSVAEGESEYIYNGETYVAYNDTILSNGVSIITRVKKDGDKYSYEFYNISGKMLLRITNFETSNCVLTYHGYQDKNHILVYISTNKGGVGYTLLLDR